MESLYKFIELNFGLSFLVGLILVALVIFGVWWMAKMYFIYRVNTRDTGNRTEEAHRRIDALPCEAHQTMINETRELAARLDGKMDALISMTMDRNAVGSALVSDVEKHSPRRVTDSGMRLLDESGALALLDANLPTFVGKLDELRPQTAYDVEQGAYVVLNALSSLPIFNALKNWVYNAPAREVTLADGTVTRREITLPGILFPLSIILRDRYLAHHPEIAG